MSRKILLLGNPNVGKSALFQAICGQYVEVSNYPGTTVELLQARLEEGDRLIDTPGVYGISSLNDEERITKEALQQLSSKDLIVNVINATTLQRDLFLTLHLIDLKLPFIMVINQIDEARRLGIQIDHAKLSSMLGVKAFPISAITGEGLEELKVFLQTKAHPSLGNQSPELEGEISKFVEQNKLPLPHFDALMLMEEDADACSRWQMNPVKGSRNAIYAKRRQRVNKLLEVSQRSQVTENALQKTIDKVLIHPLWGSVFGLLVAFFFLYQVLGVWVAGDLVNLLENHVFEKHWNSKVRWGVAHIVPSEITVMDAASKQYHYHSSRGLLFEPTLRQTLSNRAVDPNQFQYVFSPADLIDSPGATTQLQQDLWSSLGTILAGKYGLLTLTITYLLGVLLPLVWFFYLSWALFEDSGYLPRLAVLADGFLRKLGLNGRGVIPLVLGLGCVTMAVVTTRLLSNKREQLIMMILLGLAVPCSAQLGIIQGLLAKIGGLSGWLIWLFVLVSVLTLSGFLANKIIKGQPTPLILELPPLRLPHWKNVLQKANQKSFFFLKESGVAFFWASTIITVFQVTGVLTLIIEALKPLVSGILHLPKEVALSFLLGMVRRDFGAFGLLDLTLSKVQAVTACVTLTLFVPCIATLGVMVKERNFQTAFGIWLGSWVFGFAVGGLLTRLLEMISY